MNEFIKNTMLYLLPFFFYLIIHYLFDPYNYHNHNYVPKEIKNNISKKIGTHLYKIIDYQNNPKKNIVLGDSRSNRLFDNIKAKKESWGELSYGAASLNEVLNTLNWLLNEEYELDTVLIGVNFNLYNKLNKRDWVENTLNKKRNMISIAFSLQSFQSIFEILKYYTFKTPPDIGKPKISKEQFWQNQLNFYSKKFYSNYEYPKDYYLKFKELINNCKSRNINVIIWIPPISSDLFKFIEMFNLNDQYQRFIYDMNSLGKVYVFNDELLIKDKSNFTDPSHFTFKVGEIIYKDIFHID